MVGVYLPTLVKFFFTSTRKNIFINSKNEKKEKKLCSNVERDGKSRELCDSLFNFFFLAWSLLMLIILLYSRLGQMTTPASVITLYLTTK